MSSESEFVALGPGEAERIDSPIGGLIMLMLRGEQSDDALTAFEARPDPNEGPPLHTHPNADEAMYVIEGEFRFKLGDEITVMPPGSFVFIPRGAPHTWQCHDGPGRMLVVFTPSGMEQFFERSAAEPGMEAFAKFGQEAGLEVVGPPLAVSDPV